MATSPSSGAERVSSRASTSGRRPPVPSRWADVRRRQRTPCPIEHRPGRGTGRPRRSGPTSGELLDAGAGDAALPGRLGRVRLAGHGGLYRSERWAEQPHVLGRGRLLAVNTAADIRAEETLGGSSTCWVTPPAVVVAEGAPVDSCAREPSSAGSGSRRDGPHHRRRCGPRRRDPAWDQRRAVTGAGSMSSKDWFSPAMAHTNE